MREPTGEPSFRAYQSIARLFGYAQMSEQFGATSPMTTEHKEQRIRGHSSSLRAVYETAKPGARREVVGMADALGTARAKPNVSLSDWPKAGHGST